MYLRRRYSVYRQAGADLYGCREVLHLAHAHPVYNSFVNVVVVVVVPAVGVFDPSSVVLQPTVDEGYLVGREKIMSFLSYTFNLTYS